MITLGSANGCVPEACAAGHVGAHGAQEYPELLVRATYYLDDARIRTYTDLPVDLQNRMLRTACG